MRQTSIKQIARQRIQTLLDEAKKAGRSDPKLAAGYVKSARKIAMAARVRLPDDFRRQTCRSCDALFVMGYNVRVRVKQKREPHVLITCLNCGKQKRIMLRLKEKKNREQNNDAHETPR